MTDNSAGLGLAEAIEQLRADLASAQEMGSRGAIQFPIQSLTVELKVGLTRSHDGKAGFTVPFIGVEVGGSAGRSSEELQTITLVLGAPLDRDGRPVKVGSGSEHRKE